VVFVLLGAGAAGCAIPGSVGGYFENRRHDLIDVLHLDASAVNLGAIAYAGPLIVGADYQTGLQTRTRSDTLQLGLGGWRFFGRKGLAAGLLWPYSRWNEDRSIFGERPKKAPSGLSVGATVGVVGGLAIEADVLELVDFLVGLTCLDLLEDDPVVVGEAEPDEAEPEGG
jgi:hypothetical protein